MKTSVSFADDRMEAAFLSLAYLRGVTRSTLARQLVEERLAQELADPAVAQATRLLLRNRSGLRVVS